MNNTVKISGVIDTTDSTACLGMEIWIDDQQIFNQDWVKESQSFSYDLIDNDADHELKFVMKNKTTSHTQVDEHGQITKDACLIVSNLTFDEISLGQILTEKTVYEHNFNGAGEFIQDKFYGTMGCNGHVSLKFSTPMYLWLLENI